MGPQELDDAAGDFRRVAGVRTPAILGCLVHAGDEVEIDDVAANLVDGFRVHHVRWHEEDWSSINRGLEVHEPEEVPEEEVLDESLTLYEEPLLQPADAAVLGKDMAGLH